MFVVLIQSGAGREYAYGPFEQAEALRFAEFASKEIDPATVIPLRSALFELLSWRDAVQGRDAFEEAVDQMVAGGLITDLKKTAAAEAPATADHQPNEA